MAASYLVTSVLGVGGVGVGEVPSMLGVDGGGLVEHPWGFLNSGLNETARAGLSGRLASRKSGKER